MTTKPRPKVQRQYTTKAGTTVFVVKPKKRHNDEIVKLVTEALRAIETDIVGYAVVVWDAKWTAVTTCDDHSNAPPMMIPDYVRNLLLQEVLSWGQEPVDGDAS